MAKASVDTTNMSPSGSTSSAAGSSLSSCLGSSFTGGTVPEALPAAFWPGGASSGAGLKGSCVLSFSHALPTSSSTSWKLSHVGEDLFLIRSVSLPQRVLITESTGLLVRAEIFARSHACITTVLFKRIVWDATSLRIPCQNQVHMVGVLHAGLAQLHKVGVDHFGKVSSLDEAFGPTLLVFLCFGLLTLDSRKLLMAGDMVANAAILSAQTEERSQGQRSQTGGLEA